MTAIEEAGGRAAQRSRWRAAEGFLPLAPEEVRVWRVRVGRPPLPQERLLLLLSPEERARAAGMRGAGDRARFVVARGVLRTLLGSAVGLPAAAVPLLAPETGKPALAGAARGSGVRFNVSHAGDLALCAVALGREVGVDVERIRARTDCEAVAARHFGPVARRRLLALPAARRREAFFRHWSRAEALLKAWGTGWAGAAGAFAWLEAEVGEADDPPWEVVDLEPGPGYAGAVAAAGRNWRLVCLDLGAPDR